MANIYGRQVVMPMTNKSGGGVVAGDVVIIDTGNDNAFTTTTTGQYQGSVGIAQETIANNASGRVLVHGYAALVNVPSSMTRGRFLETHTVAKQATQNTTRRAGSFGQYLTGGTTPTAWLWGFPDNAGASGETVATSTIWDAAGDLVQGTGADAGARLAIGTAGQLLRVNSGATAAEWASLLTESENFITGDVTMTNANQFYDGPSLSLAAGTYFLLGTITAGENGGGSMFTAKLWDGTNVFGPTSSIRCEASTVQASGTLVGWAVLGSTTTVKISMASTGTGRLIKATATNNGVTNKGSGLIAIKVA